MAEILYGTHKKLHGNQKFSPYLLLLYIFAIFIFPFSTFFLYKLLPIKSHDGVCLMWIIISLRIGFLWPCVHCFFVRLCSTWLFMCYRVYNVRFNGEKKRNILTHKNIDRKKVPSVVVEWMNLCFVRVVVIVVVVVYRDVIVAARCFFCVVSFERKKGTKACSYVFVCVYV